MNTVSRSTPGVGVSPRRLGAGERAVLVAQLGKALADAWRRQHGRSDAPGCVDGTSAGPRRGTQARDGNREVVA